MMIQANSVTVIVILIVAYNLVIHDSSKMNSPTTVAPNIPDEWSNDNDKVDSSNVIQNQIELKFHTAISSILDKYFIDLKTHLTAESDVSKLENDKNDLKTELADFFGNKLSPSILLENIELNNKLLQLNDTLKKINQDKEQTLAEYLEINKKYIKSLETLTTCENRVSMLYDHQVKLEKNLTVLQYKIKDIIHENNSTKVEMKNIIDNLQSVILSKNQQYSNISLMLEKKIDGNNKMIEESIALKQEQAEKLQAIENEYQLNLTNKQQELEIFKEIIFKDFVKSAALLRTLTEIMKFNDDNVPDNLLKRRQELFELNYDEKQIVVVDKLRKRFDDIALRSTSQFSNKYFCNKKRSYYDSTVCAFLSEDSDNYEINLSQRNWVVLPKDIFTTGFENVENLYLSSNRLDHLEPGTFINLSNLQKLQLQHNNLTALPTDIFNGLEKLEDLNLSWNKLNSIQPSTFNNLSNLQRLDLGKNKLTALSSDIFNGLEKLEELYLLWNKLNSIQPGTLNNLSNLRRLRLDHNKLTALSSDIFSGLEKLEVLDLSSNKLSCLQPLIIYQIFQSLRLDRNKLTGFSSDIFNGLKKLEVLWLFENQINSLQSGTFNNLLNLRELWIQENRLTSLPKDIFLGLENLKMLDLSSNRLRYLDSDIFSNLPVLHYLDIKKNNLTTELINILKKKMYDLGIRWIS